MSWPEFVHSFPKKRLRFITPGRIANENDASPLIRQKTMEPGILRDPGIQSHDLASIINIYRKLHLIPDLTDSKFAFFRFRRNHNHKIKRRAILCPMVEIRIDSKMPNPTGRALRRIYVQDTFRLGVQRTDGNRVHLDSFKQSRCNYLLRQHPVQVAVYPYIIARWQEKAGHNEKRHKGPFIAATHIGRHNSPQIPGPPSTHTDNDCQKMRQSY